MIQKDEQKNKKLGDLPYRSLVNGIGGLLVAVFIFFAEFESFRGIFALAIATIAGLALWEYFQLLNKKGLQPPYKLGIAAAVIYIFVSFLQIFITTPAYETFFRHGPPIILGFFLFFCFAYYAFKGSSPLYHIATVFLGLIYITVPLGLVLCIVYCFSTPFIDVPIYQGSWWIFYLIAVTKSADMGGYFIGRRFGKRKLAFKLSPNKTIEGAIAGVIASIFISVGIYLLGSNFSDMFQGFSLLQMVWMGALLGVVGQMGDLAESLLKRDANVKDSNAIPGVGGVLDMIDSLLFTTPLLYLILSLKYG